MPPTHQVRRHFRSALTGEFGAHRRSLKADLMIMPGALVCEQTEFLLGSGKTLEKLDGVIRG
jgi:hypothetical protein